ncbi:MAG: P-II family nitrogen regulator [Planctomycetaceae bacterium]|nr:P-II family nitrogen regulator [Planctomycetaceae bacterium]
MEYEAIVAIVERGKANAIVKKVTDAGAHGATIAYGRGSGEQVFSFFRSLQVESSKEIILIISPREKLDTLYTVVVEAANVREKGKGIAFTIPICNLTGISMENGEKKDD